MRLLDSELYLTLQEAVECGMNYKTIVDAKGKGSKNWDVINDPDDARRLLVGYEGLTEERKRLVQSRYGNPYEHVARTPILAMVVNDPKAHDYYMAYSYELNGKKVYLPNNPGKAEQNVVNRYTRSAAWLKMICELDKEYVRKVLCLSMVDFYLHVGTLVKLEKDRGRMDGYAGMDVLPGEFPSSYQRLMDRAKEYGETGYGLLIHFNYGNKHAAKLGKVSSGSEQEAGADVKMIGGGVVRQAHHDITDSVISEVSVPKNEVLGRGKGAGKVVKCSGKVPEIEVNVPKIGSKRGDFDPALYEEQMAVIRSVASSYQNLDAGQVARMVNIIFEAKGWKALSRETVGGIIRDNKHLLTSGRKGKRAYMSEVAMQVTRKAPEHPLMYWTLDGWTVELMYREYNTKLRKEEYKRLVAVIVLDACGKYPVGYAVGERENVELIKEANRNAVAHVQELFGGRYQPWQVQSDNYQIKALTPFFQAVTLLHTPAAVGNAKAKIIEPYFMYLNKNYCQLHANWTGFNINSKKANQVNVEMLNKIKKTFPDKAGVVKQIEDMILRERMAKVADYVSRWESAEKKEMRDVDYLQVFGVPMGKTNRLAGQGIVKTIANVQYVYDSFEPEFRANFNINWQLLCDVNDMSKVLAVSPDNKMRFVLEEKRVIPMDVKSLTPADHDYLKRTRDFNKKNITEITELYAADAAVTQRVLGECGLIRDDAQELAMKMMFIDEDGQQKEGIQDAKGLGKVQAKQRRDTARVAREQVAAVAQEQEQYFESRVPDMMRTCGNVMPAAM